MPETFSFTNSAKKVKGGRARIEPLVLVADSDVENNDRDADLSEYENKMNKSKQ